MQLLLHVQQKLSEAGRDLPRSICGSPGGAPDELGRTSLGSGKTYFESLQLRAHPCSPGMPVSDPAGSEIAIEAVPDRRSALLHVSLNCGNVEMGPSNRGVEKTR